MKTKFLYYFGLLILAFVICLSLILPYFKTGFFPSHDGEWTVVRLADMYREVKDFQFPPRFSGYLNFQYGYPLFNFAYPLPYYLGLVFVFLKLGFVSSIKILFALSVILSFVSMFLLSKSLWKSKWAALASSILYVYVPYRIVDLYVRGSIGESLSFVIFPLILLEIKRIRENKKIIDMAIVGVLYALLITTHNIMAVLFGIIILFILFVSIIRKEIKFFVNIISAIIFSLCLSAFFWIPAIFEKNLILLSKIPIADRGLYFIKPMQLLIPQWGYGTPTDPSPFGYQIGTPQVIVFILAIVIIVRNFIKKRDKYTESALLLILITIAMIMLLFSPTAIIWNNTPLLSEINYPWTLLAVIVFLISLLAGYLVRVSKLFTVLVLALSILAMVMFIPHAKPQQYFNKGDDYYVTNQATTTSSNELMPLSVTQFPQETFVKKVQTVSGKVENIVYNSKNIVFSINLPKSEKVRINTIYYPGWKFYVDGKQVKINYDNKMGLMDIDVQAGSHLIKGEFTEVVLRLISDIISMFSILGLIVFLSFYSINKVVKKI